MGPLLLINSTFLGFFTAFLPAVFEPLKARLERLFGPAIVRTVAAAALCCPRWFLRASVAARRASIC